jgi:large subunit ribosomal protein L19
VGHKGLSVAAQSVTTAPETEAEAQASTEESFSETTEDAVPAVLTPKKVTPRVKDIMKILNSEALLAATKDITLPDIRPGDVVQIRFEVPENKRRVSLLRGIVISRRNAGINTTFRIRRVMAGVGVEIVFPL